MKNIVLYHKNCLDGTCAAWIASQYLKEEETEYIPVSYDKSLYTQLSQRNNQDNRQDTLYILDWCPEMSDLDVACANFGKVILIDHHESAIKKLKEHYRMSQLDPKEGRKYVPDNLEPFLAYNNEWSGAMGTAIWFENSSNRDIYKTTKMVGQRLSQHWLVKAVDDRDRWQFKYSDTKAINAALFSLGFDLKDWQKQKFTDYAGWILKGLSLLEQQEKNVQAIISSAAILDDNEEKIIFCNCPPFLASEVGNILAKDYRLAVLWFMDKEGQISVSLRSNSATPDWINCSKIAIALNGGGHANAAGFKMDASLEEIILALDDALIDTEQSIELY